jgi:hypothetical protein
MMGDGRISVWCYLELFKYCLWIQIDRPVYLNINIHGQGYVLGVLCQLGSTHLFPDSSYQLIERRRLENKLF